MQLAMHSNVIEKIRMRFNVAVFDLNGDRIRENSCVRKFCYDDILSSSREIFFLKKNKSKSLLIICWNAFRLLLENLLQ